MLPTKLLIWEFTSAKREGSEPEAEGGCETDAPEAVTPDPGWTGLEPDERGGTAEAIIFLTGNTRDAPESAEPGPPVRSPCSPSPIPARVPTAVTIGASEVPNDKQH